jgi:hypothetical protein
MDHLDHLRKTKDLAAMFEHPRQHLIIFVKQRTWRQREQLRNARSEGRVGFFRNQNPYPLIATGRFV